MSTFTFGDLAGGDLVAIGRARYRAIHGDTATADLLVQVDGAYAAAGLDATNWATPAEPANGAHAPAGVAHEIFDCDGTR